MVIFHFFHCGIIFYCVNIPDFAYSLITWWTFRLFRLLANFATMNVLVQAPLNISFISLMCTLRSWTAGSKCNFVCKICRIPKLFPEIASLFYIPTSSIYQGYDSYTFSATFLSFCLSDYTNFSGCKWYLLLLLFYKLFNELK